MSETELRAAALAQAALAQDAAAALTRRAQARSAPARIRVDAPGDGPVAEDRRAWAIQQMMAENPPVLRPGGPRTDLVYKLPDGSTRVVRNVTPPRAVQVIRPGEVSEEALDYRWEFRERNIMNAALAKHYGVEACVEAGIFTEFEARWLDPEQIRPVKLPPGAPR